MLWGLKRGVVNVTCILLWRHHCVELVVGLFIRQTITHVERASLPTAYQQEMNVSRVVYMESEQPGMDILQTKTPWITTFILNTLQGIAFSLCVSSLLFLSERRCIILGLNRFLLQPLATLHRTAYPPPLGQEYIKQSHTVTEAPFE